MGNTAYLQITRATKDRAVIGLDRLRLVAFLHCLRLG
jgi:hypothetical protein